MGAQIYNERQRYIIPTSDWGFKRLFGSEINKGLLIGLLNKIIDDRVIEDVTYLERDVLVPVGRVRQMSFDVYCKCADGSRVIVEMQNYAKTTFVDRALVYTSASILENYSYSRSRDYQVQKTYLIAITGEKVFPEVDHAPVRLALCDIDSPERRVLNDKILQIFIELPKFANEIGDLNKDSSFLNKFAVAMKTMAGCDKRPELMDDAMLVGLFEAADLHRYKTKDLNSYKDSVMNEFEYEETLKEYREEGRAEGIAQTAKKLKEQGISLETIALCTGLDVETIESL